MPRKASTKGPSDQEIAVASAKLFATKGYAKTTLEDVAGAVSISSKQMKSRFSSKSEVAAQAFKLGRQSMELATQRMGGAITISDYLGQVFDGLLSSTEPWGPEGYFQVFYQATKDNELRALVKKASEDTMLTLKFNINDMIDHDLITEQIKPEAVAEEFLTKFIEDLAMLSQGREIEDVKKAWVNDASSILLKGLESKED